jgi:hypothetical protein
MAGVCVRPEMRVAAHHGLHRAEAQAERAAAQAMAWVASSFACSSGISGSTSRKAA